MNKFKMSFQTKLHVYNPNDFYIIDTFPWTKGKILYD
jgi:hypothetical protein